jgi:hypothetical protein
MATIIREPSGALLVVEAPEWSGVYAAFAVHIERALGPGHVPLTITYSIEPPYTSATLLSCDFPPGHRYYIHDPLLVGDASLTSERTRVVFAPLLQTPVAGAGRVLDVGSYAAPYTATTVVSPPHLTQFGALVGVIAACAMDLSPGAVPSITYSVTTSVHGSTVTDLHVYGCGPIVSDRVAPVLRVVMPDLPYWQGAYKARGTHLSLANILAPAKPLYYPKRAPPRAAPTKERRR